MMQLKPYLIGPEVFWILLYTGALWLKKANPSGDNRMDPVIEKLWFWIPAMSLLTFALWWIPGVEKGGGLLLRVWISGLIGGHLVLEKAISAYSRPGPGIGMGYLAGMMLLLFFLAVGSLIVWL